MGLHCPATSCRWRTDSRVLKGSFPGSRAFWTVYRSYRAVLWGCEPQPVDSNSLGFPEDMFTTVHDCHFVANPGRSRLPSSQAPIVRRPRQMTVMQVTTRYDHPASGRLRRSGGVAVRILRVVVVPSSRCRGFTMTGSTSIPAALLNRATRAFGNERKARRWLTRPHHVFDGSTPLKVIRAEDGRNRIYDVLGRIEHGIYD